MIRRIIAIALPALLVLALVGGCGGVQGETTEGQEEAQGEQAGVPAKYEELYLELDTKLGDIETYLEGTRTGRTGDTIFSAELIIANGNRGESLLYSGTLYAIETTLDSLQTMGITGITMSIGYPLLSPSFPRSAEYLDFYKQVVAEIRKRGLTLIIDSTTLFPNMGISDEDLGYAGLTLGRYMQEKRLMVETVLRELQPDYYTIENEPLTMLDNTGLDFSVENQTQVVNFILSGLDRSGTRIGAGAGTWDDIAYFESLARNTDIDYMDMHIYPIQQDFVVDKIQRIADAAHSTGKGVAVGEAWLYKAGLSQLGPGHNVAAAAEVFSLDTYSFWIPLDERFLEVMVALAHELDFEYLNPFWAQYFFAYLDYNSSMEEQGIEWVSELSNSKAWINIQAEALSPTGEKYRELIER